MKKLSLKTTAIITSISLFSSCAPTISNFGSYRKQPISKTAFMPSEDIIKGNHYKVVVFGLDDQDNQTAKQANLGDSIAVNLENVLAKNNLATLVDRKAAAKLEKEIALAEMNKTGSYKGPDIADYAISGAISNAGFTKKYTAGGVSMNANKSITRTPPKFTYTAETSGNIKIYELPSMAVVQNLDFTGKKVRTENVQADNNISIGGLIEFGGQQAKGIDRDDNLVRKSGEDAVDLIAFDLKNFFGQRGYILEKRIMGKKAIFKISVGHLDGIKQGDKFEVYGKYESENQVTGKTDIEKRTIAKGAVTDKIDAKSSWIIIDDAKDADSIRIGDTVQFKYKRGFFSKMERLFSFASNLAS